MYIAYSLLTYIIIHIGEERTYRQHTYIHIHTYNSRVVEDNMSGGSTNHRCSRRLSLSAWWSASLCFSMPCITAILSSCNLHTHAHKHTHTQSRGCNKQVIHSTHSCATAPTESAAHSSISFSRCSHSLLSCSSIMSLRRCC